MTETEKSDTASFYAHCFVFCFLCFVFIITGCATQNEIGRMQWDLNKLKSDVRDVKQKSPSQRGQLNKRLQGLEDEQKATSNAVSDLLMKVQSLSTEVQVLTGRFEEARYFSEKSLKELETSVNGLKEKLVKLEGTGTPAEKQKQAEEVKKAEERAKTAKTAETEETGKKQKTPLGKEAKDAYIVAYRLYKDGEYEEARKRFEAILENYPENELSDNALFWIGETYYKEKNYEDAILTYDELMKKSPKSDKVRGALLKQGLSFYALKKQGIGKTILQELIEKYPDSDEAKIAKRKIAPTPLTKKRVAPLKKKQ